jgi:hypothetical protein
MNNGEAVFWFGLALGVVLGFLAGFTCPWRTPNRQQDMEQWAVESGHAEYFLNAEHEREFRWLECEWCQPLESHD